VQTYGDVFKEESIAIMQFCGLLDKNGVEIYEADVVRILYTDWRSKSENDTRSLEQYLIDISQTAEIVFYGHGFYAKMYSKKYDDFNYGHLNVGKYGFIEVIGNVFDNPELLKS